MRRFRLLLVGALVLTPSLYAVAQEKESHEMTPAKATFDKAVLQKVWDGWCSLDPANAAKYYGKEKAHVFYDVAPLQYHGWAEYEAGVKPMLAQWKSAKCKVNYDGQIREETPTMAWSASTVEMNIVTKEGKEQNMTVRWTAIWHKHGANWVIAHEHVSAPMQ
jgi:ketosteroid isomerase-like protein